jgi:hypothetical protein
MIAGRLDAAGQSVVRQENAACCCARGDKGWVSDPKGISWETFHTFGEHGVRQQYCSASEKNHGR